MTDQTREIICPNCSKRGKIAVASIPEEGRTLKCPSCKNPFLVEKNIPREDDNIGTTSEKQGNQSTKTLSLENFDKYAEFTKNNDWKSICKLNGIDLDSFGTKKELKVLPEYLEDGEVVFALTSGIMSQTETSNAFDWGTNTWLVALTNERFLLLDHAMLSSSVDTQSIRHNSVQAVSASQGIMFGKIQVDLGARVVVIDNCQKATVKVLANLANKWLKILQTQTISPAGGFSEEAFFQIQESVKLARIQIENQERIIALLEQISKNITNQS